ncbi:Clp protease N-terminal domain-containing protein [Algibacter lectus]|uniref:Clp protease N-terminal domain-containing protein n=1 Tax=Algibacter lectus TaxID=221126 RepID=UPI0026EF5101|nr:Clp protease N-terminal domain-containing protein [Algibacter lectus]MDO7135591.1 Clp protease N-terminal domain-containing protein [Algibacter lectus]
MNKEINFKEIIEILTRHLKAIISIKSEFVELKDYEKVSKFRDYEKEIETQLELLKGNKNAIKKPLHIKEQQVSKLNFSNESKKVLKSINKENALIFTKDLTLSILNNGNSELSDIFLKLGVEINDLKNDLKNSSIKDDIASKEHPLFTLKTLKAIDTSFLEVKLTKEKEVTPYTILLGILRNKNDFTTKTLNTYGITYKNLFTEIKKRPSHNNI